MVVDVQNGMPFLSRLVARCPVLVLVHHVHREQWRSCFGPVLGRIGWWMESWLAPRLYRKCRYVTVSEHTRAELADARRRRGPHHRGAQRPGPGAAHAGRRATRGRCWSRWAGWCRTSGSSTRSRWSPGSADRWPDLRLEIVGRGSWHERCAAYAAERGRRGPGHPARLGRRAGQARDPRALVGAPVPVGQGGLGHRGDGGRRARRADGRLPRRRRGGGVGAGRQHRPAGRRLRRVRGGDGDSCCGASRLRTCDGRGAAREHVAGFEWEHSVRRFDDVVVQVLPQPETGAEPEPATG